MGTTRTAIDEVKQRIEIVELIRTLFGVGWIYEKGRLAVQNKNPQDMGCFFNSSMGQPDKKLSQWEELQLGGRAAHLQIVISSIPGKNFDNKVEFSALLSLDDPNNIQASPLPSNSDIPAAFLLPYLGNTSLF